MTSIIQLPTDALIDDWSFCRAIARAVCPAGEQELQGMDCIIGKQLRIESRIVMSAVKEQWPIETQSQLVLTSSDGRTLGELLQDASTAQERGALCLPLEDPPKVAVMEFPLPYALTEEDRHLLEKLLPSLPPLRYPMSDEDVKEFMEAYLRLPARPEWQPILVTPSDLERWKAQQEEIFGLHRMALQDELSTGRLSAVNEQNIPVKRLSARSRIPRAHAIEYLKRCGIPYEHTGDQRHLEKVLAPSEHSGAATSRAAEPIVEQALASTPIETSTTEATKASPFLLNFDQARPLKSENEKRSPHDLRTPEIALAFDGLGGWDKEKWARYLTETQWPEDAMTCAGRPGKGGAALWNPITLALCAQKIRGISLHQYTKVFRNTKSLRPWLEKWEEYVENEKRLRD